MASGAGGIVERSVGVWFLMLILAALCCTGAGEEAAVGAPEEESRAAPAVIDRWNNPDAYPDFSFAGEEDLLEIWFPRIRDRDAAILTYQGQVWMIDCSDEQAEERVVPLLKALGIQRIHRIVNTHPHHDHLNGLYAVDAACPVEELLICFPEDCNENMIRAAAYCRGKGIALTLYGDEEILSMGDGLVRLQCWMKTDETQSMNDQSAQLMLSFGMRTMLFMADMEGAGQDQLYAAVPAEKLAADILRYPHHGKLAMRERLFEAIAPALVVVTSSENVAEVKESTRFLSYRHVPRAYTTGGYLHLVTDGVTWLAERVPEETLFNEHNGIRAPVMTDGKKKAE